VGLVQLLTTVDTEERALELARSAIDTRAAACVQVIGPIRSVYRWEGRTENSAEYLCLLKCPAEALERLTVFVRERHPYDTPEIMAVESLYVDDRYLAWARAETSGSGDPGEAR
jgi:periplasmic divalent cation tolerance protein